MAGSNNPPLVSVLALAFPDHDLLDIVGPLEVFSNSRSGRSAEGHGEAIFTATIAGPKTASTLQWMTVAPDIDFEQALESIDSYDILLVPGATLPLIESFIADFHLVLEIIETFSKLSPPLDASGSNKLRPRVLMSVCTGAAFLAHLGLFKGRKCTTHPYLLKRFQEILAEKGGEYVDVSWVDGGYLDSGVNILSTGGNTNGTDGALYLVKKLCGAEVKEQAVLAMCYQGLERSGIVQEQ